MFRRSAVLVVFNSRAGRLCGAGVGLLVAGLAAGCSGTPVNDGPVEGSRAVAGSVSVCVPIEAADIAFFGDLLRNAGDRPAEVIQAVLESRRNVDSERSQILTNAGGPPVGTFVFPATYPDEDRGEAQANLDRSRPLVGAVLRPGEEANVLTGLVPATRGEPASVESVLVTYRVGDREYRERIGVEYTAAPHEC